MKNVFKAVMLVILAGVMVLIFKARMDVLNAEAANSAAEEAMAVVSPTPGIDAEPEASPYPA